MSRSQIWDGVAWVSMTGGAGESGGGTDPDDNYLRLDGANNNPHPNNFLRRIDTDLLYLDIAGGHATNFFIDDSGISYTGVTHGGGAANRIGLTWGGITPSKVTVSIDNAASYAIANHATFASYLALAGGTMTGPLNTPLGTEDIGAINLYDGANLRGGIYGTSTGIRLFSD
ncbi:unnamed protein product, partial [marine sediment metagenome]